MIKFKVEGLQQLERRLLAFGPEVARNGLRSANFAGVKVIIDAIESSMTSTEVSAPGDPPGIDSGLLKANIVSPRRRTAAYIAKHSIVVRGRRRTKSKVTKIGKRRGGGYRAVAGPAAYGKMLEFGTSKMAARPFMRPALEAKTRQAIEAIGNGLRRAVDRAAKKIAK